mmetsp:Transcript_13740/g.31830  ORF Transcript_13740/g.31830 Transcript_13740/m.31830 type:complete len:208 (-) Transcript_13740:2541-3164(-)
MSPAARMIDVQIKKLKICLCFSKRPRHTVEYMNSVVYVMRLPNRSSRSSDLSLESMQSLNSFWKYVSEYWYMWSMFPRSAITKYMMLPRVAATRYASRASLMAFSVDSASLTRSEIILLVILLCSSVEMRLLLSRMLPSDSLSSLSTLSSSSLSCFLSLAIDTTSLSFCASRSGRSLRTTSPSSWSSRPFIVTVKLMIVVLMQTSGM